MSIYSHKHLQKLMIFVRDEIIIRVDVISGNT